MNQTAQELTAAAQRSLEEAHGQEAGVEDEERADYLVERSQAEAILAIALRLGAIEEALQALARRSDGDG